MQVNTSIALLADGSVEPAAWLAFIARQYQEPHVKLIQAATELCCQHDAKQSIMMAAILAELRADHETLIAALLYGLVQQELISPEKIQAQFGQSVLRIIKAALSLQMVQDLKRFTQGGNSQAERFRQMILAMINDVRAVLLKLAECVCIMRSIKSLEPDKRKLLAFEILHIYAPLANRLGIGQIKWELEDRAFACLYSDSYFQISEYLHERRLDRERYIERLKEVLLKHLQQANIEAELSGRAKHIYSIWRKMQSKQLKFQQLFDIQALRILVPDIAACYAALSCVHDIWEPIAAEFRDYIVSPKPNGYRSIHTVVIGPDQKRIEVQIRTFAMHEESEKGIAAHWRYKEGMLGAENQELEKISSKAMNERVYVFTPQGEVIDLPKGSTPLDFAYRVHTEIGHRCQGAKVNGKLVPLNSILQSADKVEILLGKTPKPSRDWLSRQDKYIATQQARKKIEHWFRLQEELKSNKAEKLLQENEPEPTEPDFEFNLKKLRQQKDDVIVYGVDNLLSRAGGCCRPIMGDEIIGYVTQGRGITVHRRDCQVPKAISAQYQNRLIEVKWAENAKARYPVYLGIYAQNRSDLLKDFTHLFTEESLAISNLQSMLDQDNIALTYILTEVSNTEQMQRIMNLLKQVPGVIDVKRGR
ncbi:MAG: ilvM [Gammaproteobacteria bacterium]|nr:ilvM [Gammaproteobacteria bacterium]